MDENLLTLQTLSKLSLPKIDNDSVFAGETSPVKRCRLAAESQRLVHYVFELMQKLNNETECKLDFIEACRYKALSIGIEKERRDLISDDGTVIRSCVNTLIKISQGFPSLVADADDLVQKCLFLTLDMIHLVENDKAKILLLLEILTSVNVLKKHGLGAGLTGTCDASTHMVQLRALNMQNRRNLIEEDYAFTPVVVQSPDEDLDAFNGRQRIQIEALEEILRVTHQFYKSGLVKTEYERDKLCWTFEKALSQLLDIGYIVIDTDEFKKLTINLHRIKRALRSVNTTPEEAERLGEELQEVRDELVLHLHFSPDSFIAYVNAIETITNILSERFGMQCPKLKVMNIIIENLYKLYSAGCILDDCDPSDRFSTIMILNECNKVYGSLPGIKRVDYPFLENEDFSEGLETANACTNIFLFTKAMACHMIEDNVDLPEVARKNLCPFKASIIKIFK